MRSAVIDRVRRVVLAAAMALALAPASLAQQPAPTPAAPLAALESIKLSLDQLEITVNRDGLSATALVDLQGRLTALQADLRARRGEIEPQLGRIAARLKELGPAPGRDGPPEQSEIATERDQLTRQVSELDSASKLANLLSVRADQLADRLNERRSIIFTQRLFERSQSLLDPLFWIEAAGAVPEELRSSGFLLQSWWGYAQQNGGYGRMAAALATLAAFAAAAAAARIWWRRRARRQAPSEGRFAKALSALGVLVETALALPLVLVIVMATLSAYGLVPDRIAGIGTGLAVAVVAAGIGRGIGRGVLAPRDAGRRLPAIDDATAQLLARHLIVAARALGAAIFLNVIHREVVAPVVLTTATNALLAFIVGALLVHALLGVRAADDEGSRVRWLRTVAWIVTVATGVALALGYIGVATFLVERLLSVVACFAVLYLLLVLVDALFTEVLTAGSPRAHAVAARLGVRPRSLELAGTLVSAIVRLLLIAIAVIVPFATRGTFATEIFGSVQGPVFGLSIGQLNFSLVALLGGVAMLLVGLVATRGAQRWLATQFLPRTTLDPGLQNSVTAILGYVGVIAAVTLALATFGIDLQKVALIAGALSVGIGFGLQSIVSNFVSGLILLAERPIRVGDSIVVKGEEGYVRRISVRATEIETFERASVIIPNSELISGVVKNWTHANTNARIIVKVGVAYDCDPDQVRDILMACACDHPQVLQKPAPTVFLLGFGDSALEFELRCIVTNVDYGPAVRSDLHFAVLHRFRAAGIEIPRPQRDIRVLHERDEPKSPTRPTKPGTPVTPNA